MPDCSLITATYHVDGKLAGKDRSYRSYTNEIQRGNVSH